MHILGKFHWYWICSSRVLIFRCFCTSRSCHFRLLLGVFWLELLKMLSVLFRIFTSDDMQDFQDDASDMLWIILKYYGWNCAKKLIFWLNLRGFLFTPSDTLWVTPKDFSKWKTLLRYILVVSFIRIVYVIVKLKIFKVFCIDSASMKLPILGGFGALTSPNIVPSCWNVDQWLPPIRQILLEKSFKILHFGLYGTCPKFTILVYFGVKFTARKPKILLKTKIS